MSFDSPLSYLKHIKASERRPYFSGVPSPEYVRIHFEQVEQTRTSEVNPEEFLDELYASILNRLIDLLPLHQKQKAKESLAIGIVNNSDVNAFIIRSDDSKYYAIGINSAFNSMITHFAKLIVAANNPESVVYCNGLKVEELKRRDYIMLSTKMLKKYGETGVPIVPEIKIALNSSAIDEVDFYLSAMLFFVVGHELGHFANGDLSSGSHFSRTDFFGGSFVFGAGISHDKEFKADRTAFRLILRSVAAQKPDALARPILDASVTNLFNLLREIFNRGNESHPSPSDRLLNVTREFFGSEAARIMEASFNDLSQINSFQSIVGKRTVSQVLNNQS